jgi:hypothetical protein
MEIHFLASHRTTGICRRLPDKMMVSRVVGALLHQGRVNLSFCVFVWEVVFFT